MSKYQIGNTVYLEAETYKEAVKQFWKRMDKAGISAVVDTRDLPNCFVSEVEELACTPTSD